MKLLMCRRCDDVFKLAKWEPRKCACGSSGGLYLDDRNAKFWGEEAVLLGLSNRSLLDALSLPDRDDGFGNRFAAFVIPETARTVVRLEKPDDRQA